jgi:RNA polymerase sigma-32 factor
MGYIQMLTAEEERDLATRWRRDGDERAMHRIIEAHLPLARKIAARYRWTRIDFEDLCAEANIGLLLAVKRFDPEKGFRFSTYSVFWLKAQMTEFALKMSLPVRMPTSPKFKKSMAGNPFPSTVSLDEEVDGRSGYDFLVDPSPLQDEVVDHSFVSLRVDAALGVLNQREAEIIRDRFLADETASLTDLGITHGISKERVRQVQNKALARLSAELGNM